MDEDEERMELVLNSDFDSALLDCWDEDASNPDRSDNENVDGGGDGGGNSGVGCQNDGNVGRAGSENGGSCGGMVEGDCDDEDEDEEDDEEDENDEDEEARENRDNEGINNLVDSGSNHQREELHHRQQSATSAVESQINMPSPSSRNSVDGRPVASNWNPLSRLPSFSAEEEAMNRMYQRVAAAAAAAVEDKQAIGTEAETTVGTSRTQSTATSYGLLTVARQQDGTADAGSAPPIATIPPSVSTEASITSNHKNHFHHQRHHRQDGLEGRKNIACAHSSQQSTASVGAGSGNGTDNMARSGSSSNTVQLHHQHQNHNHHHMNNQSQSSTSRRTANTQALPVPGNNAGSETASSTQFSNPMLQLHPLAIQSYASCPPHGWNARDGAGTGMAATAGIPPPNAADHSGTSASGSSPIPPFFGGGGQSSSNPELMPMALNSQATEPNLARIFGSSTPNTTNAGSSVTANMQLPTSVTTALNQQNVPSTSSATTASTTARSMPQAHSNGGGNVGSHHASRSMPSPNNKAGNHSNNIGRSNKNNNIINNNNPSRSPSAAALRNTQTAATAPAVTTARNANASRSSVSPPPFLLFDAPVELRMNFIQSQRAHGLPIMQDNNSYHFGIAVNGFHPQREFSSVAAMQSSGAGTSANSMSSLTGTTNTNTGSEFFGSSYGSSVGHHEQQRHNGFSGALGVAGQNDASGTSGQNDASGPGMGAVKLVDARHGEHGVKRIKNAKEQKRAQKITELIDQLRVKMEKGGWKVGVKSKFHILSSCAEYVQHLVKANTEKEDAVKKARCDLEAMRRKVEDEKAQQDRSDPESTTSSLTVSSGSAIEGGAKVNQTQKVSDEQGSVSTAAAGDKRGTEDEDESPRGHSKEGRSKKPRLTFDDPDDPGSTTDSPDDPCSSNDERKQPRFKSHASTISSSNSSGGDDSGKRPAGVQSLSISQTISSVSDITDSNKGSLNGGSAIMPSRISSRRPSSSTENLEATGAGSSSVSSDAAVARCQHQSYSAALRKAKKRKSSRSAVEATSLDSSFELDYEEVFVKSNVPQIIATTAGRIVAFNDFFQKATCLSKKDISRITIFSLVQSSKLSSLFEIVAAALRDPPSTGLETTGEKEEGGENGEDDGPSDEGEADKASMEKSRVEFNPSSNGNSCFQNVSMESREVSGTEKELETREKVDAHCDNLQSGSGGRGSEEKGEIPSCVTDQQQWDYAAITLPCVEFEQRKVGAGGEKPRRLHMTVTLISDEDPRKRCFHCVFTDCPGTNGALGSITPQFLAALFSKPKKDGGDCDKNKDEKMSKKLTKKQKVV